MKFTKSILFLLNFYFIGHIVVSAIRGLVPPGLAITAILLLLIPVIILTVQPWMEKIAIDEAKSRAYQILLKSMEISQPSAPRVVRKETVTEYHANPGVSRRLGIRK